MRRKLAVAALIVGVTMVGGASAAKPNGRLTITVTVPHNQGN